MKLSSYIFAIIAAEEKSQNSEQAKIVSCGPDKIYDGTASVRINSPGYPDNYFDGLFCFWKIENECNLGYDIIPYDFDVESHSICDYDFLQIRSDGDFNNNRTFCNSPNILDGELNEPYRVDGGELKIAFLSDSSTTKKGFSFDVVPVRQPSCEFTSAFSSIEGLIKNAVAGFKKNEVKKFNMIKSRFSWFTDYSDNECNKYAGEGVGVGVDYVAPALDDEDPCESVASFYPALVGYFDDFVCLDRAIEAIGGRKVQRTAHKLHRAKGVFNRILKKMSCEQRL